MYYFVLQEAPACRSYPRHHALETPAGGPKRAMFSSRVAHSTLFSLSGAVAVAPVFAPAVALCLPLLLECTCLPESYPRHHALETPAHPAIRAGGFHSS